MRSRDWNELADRLEKNAKELRAASDTLVEKKQGALASVFREPADNMMAAAAALRAPDLAAENARLRALLQRGFDLMCVKDYEVGPGEPPVLKDGVQDRWMADARAALAAAKAAGIESEDAND